MTRLIGPGWPEPLGVLPVDQAQGSAVTGINVAVHAPNATAIDLCLYDGTGQIEIDWVRLPARTGDVHHGVIGGVGIGDRYGLRAHGRWAPAEGHRFNPAKLLVDPFATRLDRPFQLDSTLFDQRARGVERDEVDSAAVVPKAIVDAPVIAPPRRALRAWREMVVYELHVKGFSRLNPEVPPESRGTFAGLAHPASIRHLTALGITAVELMPVAAMLDERHLGPLGLTNYWGYNPITHMAPDPRLAPGGWEEIRLAVAALQAAGIAVLLDVVLNHTGEGDHFGPTISYRGLDNAAWYRLVTADRSRYVDDAGCGNVLAAERPIVVRLMLEALRTWALRAGVDGFRFDLATTIARTGQGFQPDHPVLMAIGQDPVLRELLLIAEPWDIGWGGYQLGQFPAGWGEWNDRYRDTTRRFWRGDAGQLGAFTTVFAGSSDVFAPRRRPLSRSVNFITAHDGFTLADLVSHTAKQNLANGESNRDGTDNNLSWNHGVEGPTEDAAVNAARERDVRALLSTLILSRGTPMLSMGDEFGRSQGGNNNAYAQDNPISWMDWTHGDRELAAYVGRVIALRRALPVLHDEAPLTGAPEGAGLPPDVEWLNASGLPMRTADWDNGDNRLLAALFGNGGRGRVLVVVHAGWGDTELTLPEPSEGFGWQLDLDSSEPGRAAVPVLPAVLAVPRRTVMVLTERPGVPGAAMLSDQPVRPRATTADPGGLERLAGAAGIAADWWEVSGRHTSVSPETKRAILRSMGLAATTAGDIRDSLAMLSAERFDRVLPMTVLAREGEAVSLRLAGDLARTSRRIGLLIRRETGGVEELSIPPRSGEEEAVIAPDGAERIGRRVFLPPQPVGRHRLMLSDRPDLVADLIVAPAQCHVPPELRHGGRRFGVAAHLYTLRRTGDQGIGDFSTLARFAELSAAEGAVTLGLNPLHALFQVARDRASPYHPSDRRFIDPIHIDVAALPAPLRGEAVRSALWSEMRSVNALSAVGTVDYPRVWQSKQRILDLAFGVFEKLLATGGASVLAQDFDAFVDRGGLRLQRFAEFEAIAGEVGHTEWREWPDHVAATIRPDKLETAIRYQSFLQWLADRQFAAAAAVARKAGMSLGFYRDLAVGCAPDGAESWAERDRLMAGVSIGAPPDPFSASGQVWNLPPPNPRRAADDGYGYFSSLIAANMAHAGALRIDHAMGLRRLFVVPDGASGAEGAYVDMPFEGHLAVLALESRRAECLVVGEDLGTVPEGFRERLTAAEVQAYRVLWFEREGTGFVPPRHWPAPAAACVSTHDLATLAGWWQGADIEENLALGFLDPVAARAARLTRADEKHRLVDLLQAEGLLAERPLLDAPMTDSLAAAVHELVGRAPSVLALAQADDLVGEVKAVNLPGTDRERPNWRRKLAPEIDQIFTSQLARGILAAIAKGRVGGG